MKALTDGQMKYLADVAAGRDPRERYAGRGRSAFGGLSTVERSLHRRGLLDRDGITATGRAELAKAKGR